MRLVLLHTPSSVQYRALQDWIEEHGHALVFRADDMIAAATGDKLPPLFEVDLLVLGKEVPEAFAWMEEIRRAGRPVITLAEKPVATIKKELEAAVRAPRTNYQPIDCNYYDYFEAAIVQRSEVVLQYAMPNGEEMTEKMRLRDLKTVQSEEFLQLADGRWLRLDRVRALDGIPNTGEFCHLPERP